MRNQRSLVAFCDESGNTGENYGDPQQPVYVLAGWLIPTSILQQAESRVEEALRELPGNRKELHGSRVLRSPRGQEQFLKLTEQLLTLGCRSTYVLAEKKYCVAAKIVETFLDPVYNSLISAETTGDTTLRTHTAELLYDTISEAALTEFARAYRYPSTRSLNSALRMLQSELRTRGLEGYAHLIGGVAPSLQELTTAEVASRQEMPGTAAINVTVFVALFSMLGGYAHAADIAEIQIIHDETKQFGKVLKEVLEIYRNARTAIVELPNQNRLYFGGMLNVQGLSFMPSQMSPLVQAADLLASGLARYANSSQSPKLLEVVRLLFQEGSPGEPELHLIVASKSFARVFLASFL